MLYAIVLPVFTVQFSAGVVYAITLSVCRFVVSLSLPEMHRICFASSEVCLAEKGSMLERDAAVVTVIASIFSVFADTRIKISIHNVDSSF